MTGDKLLRWVHPVGETYYEALLGTGDDGVLFSLCFQPTCHRRGQWKLLVEVCGGDAHRLWGCFDDQDHPMRYYHNQDCAHREAESLARVLWAGRMEHPHPPTVRSVA